MKKVVKIKGMSCEHCVRRLERALNSLDGVVAKVSLKDKNAALSLSKPVEDRVIIDAVENAGYDVVSIKKA